MIIYGDSKETVKKQLDCKHSFVGPFIDEKFRWYTCSKCFVCNFDVSSEQEYYNRLKSDHEYYKGTKIEDLKIPDLLTCRPFTLNWYGLKKEQQEPELSEEEQDEEYSGRICAEPGCYNYPMSGIIYCIKCMHGSPQKASDEVIEWKKKKELKNFGG